MYKVPCMYIHWQHVCSTASLTATANYSKAMKDIPPEAVDRGEVGAYIHTYVYLSWREPVQANEKSIC